jgi:hypothetical protein
MTKYKRLLLAFVSALSCLWIAASFIQANASATTTHQIILKTHVRLPRAAVPSGSTSLDSVLEDFDVQSAAPLFDLSRGDVELKRALGLDNAYVVTLNLEPDGDLQDALDALAADPAVEYAEPDYVGYGAMLPDDRWFDYQWNLNNTGQSGGTPGADIDAPAAWALTLGDPATIIAVIDTGADLDHPITRSGGLSDTLSLAWDAPGAYSVTLAASNLKKGEVEFTSCCVRESYSPLARYSVPWCWSCTPCRASS